MLVRSPERKAPVTEKIAGTLLDIVKPVDDLSREWLPPVGLYQTLNCAVTGTSTAICPAPPGAKDFGQNSPSSVDGMLMALYTGFTCKLVGADFDTYMAQLKQVVENRESVAIERALQQQRFTGAAGSGGAAATILTGYQATICPELGMAYLEQDLADNYAGVGIIHMPRLLASQMAGDTLKLDGKILRTRLGTPVAAGGGYMPTNSPDGSVTAAGSFWMYATGEIAVTRGKLIERTDQDRINNDGVILLERLYEVVVDCHVSAMKVSL